MQSQLSSSGPRRFLRPELAQFGVQVIGAAPIRLRCVTCGAEWTRTIETDGRITARYWLCASGCNEPRCPP